MASVERCHEALAHRFALARADARIQRDADLPRARNPRFPREPRDASDRLLPTTTFLTCTRALGFRPAWSALASGAIEGSVASRRSGPASAGRAATRRGFSPSRRVAGVFSTPEPRSLSRSTHDIASDAPSPPKSRLRHRRSACVIPRGSRPLPPPPVKRTACHDPRRLPPVRRPFSLGAAPRACLATRPG